MIEKNMLVENKREYKNKRMVLIMILLAISLLSIFVISGIASSAKFHAKTIKTLDDKKITVMELTAATAGASTALALVPGDATTPLANQIMKLSSYLLIVTGAIFLEKTLLTITGYISFTFLIPISCLLYGIYLYYSNDVLKKLAVKLAVFAICIFAVVPVSVKISNLIEDTYKESITQTMESAKNTEIEANQNTEEKNTNEGILGGIISKTQETLSIIGNSASNIIEKGKITLSNFIDAIAVLVITTCVIPIAVLLCFVWIIKIIFGVDISVPNIKKISNGRKKIKDDDM